MPKRETNKIKSPKNNNKRNDDSKYFAKIATSLARFDKIKKYFVQQKIHTNNILITSFPNALLLDMSDKQKNKTTNTKPVTEKKIVNTENDIWNLLGNFSEDNNYSGSNSEYSETYSESLDSIETEEESDSILDAELDDNNDNNKNEDDSNNSDDNVCQECGAHNSLFEDHQSSSIVCAECGVVNEQLLDYGPEWRQYNNDDNWTEGVNRCGCPSSYYFPKSSQGTIMVGPGNARLKRKQQWNSMFYKERSLNAVFDTISALCAKKGLPKIISDTAKTLYKILSECKHKSGPNKGKQIIIRGDNRKSIIIACISKACEINKTPLNHKEFIEMSGLDEKSVTKGIKHFDRIIKNSDNKMFNMEYFNSDNDTAEDYIRRYGPKLKLNKKQMELAIKIARNSCKIKLTSDHNPQSVAAGSILIMVEYYNLNIERKEISVLFATTDVTVAKIYKKVAPFVEALIDDEATDHLIKKFKING